LASYIDFVTKDKPFPYSVLRVTWKEILELEGSALLQ